MRDLMTAACVIAGVLSIVGFTAYGAYAESRKLYLISDEHGRTYKGRAVLFNGGQCSWVDANGDRITTTLKCTVTPLSGLPE